MTTIPADYGKNGYKFRLVARVGRVALYEQWGHGKLCAYEVCWVRSRDARELFGKQQPAGEYLPSNREWGVFGKTYSLAGTTDLNARKAADAQIEAWSAHAPAAL